jgi:hypothetical protein
MSGRAGEDVGLLLFSWWGCGLENRKGHGRLSLMSVVCCRIEFSTWADHSSRGVLPNVACLNERTILFPLLISRH